MLIKSHVSPLSIYTNQITPCLSIGVTPPPAQQGLWDGRPPKSLPFQGPCLSLLTYKSASPSHPFPPQTPVLCLQHSTCPLHKPAPLPSSGLTGPPFLRGHDTSLSLFQPVKSLVTGGSSPTLQTLLHRHLSPAHSRAPCTSPVITATSQPASWSKCLSSTLGPGLLLWPDRVQGAERPKTM